MCAKRPTAAGRLDDATVGASVATMTRAFRDAGLDTPGLDARRLAAWALAIDEAALLRDPEHPLDETSRDRLAEAMARRLAREPVSRIMGRRAFHGLDFEISPATLDPRPDTEVLIDGVLALVATGATPGGTAPRILDLGTGSGAIIVTLLARLPSATGVAIDISPDALAVAARNAAHLGVANRCTFNCASWFDAVSGPFDIVVSNPPYIASPELPGLDPEVTLHDPAGALDGGPDGLAAYRAIAAGLASVLAPGGWLACEIGIGQEATVIELLKAAGFGLGTGQLQTWTDLSGIVRCVAVRART